MKRFAFISLLCSLTMVLSGCFFVNKYLEWKLEQDRQEILKIVESPDIDQQFKEFLSSFDSNAFTEQGKINSYEIDYQSLEYTPAGSINVSGYVNGDRTLSFSCMISRDQYDKLVIILATYSTDLGEITNE